MQGGCAKQRSRVFLAEHLPVVAVPVALKDFCRIVLALGRQEFRELWIASFHLLAISKPVVSEVVAAAVLDRQIDQQAESAGGVLDALRIMRDVKIEDHACVAVLGPGKEALVILFNQADNSVNH